MHKVDEIEIKWIDSADVSIDYISLLTPKGNTYEGSKRTHERHEGHIKEDLGLGSRVVRAYIKHASQIICLTGSTNWL